MHPSRPRSMFDAEGPLDNFQHHRIGCKGTASHELYMPQEILEHQSPTATHDVTPSRRILAKAINNVCPDETTGDSDGLNSCRPT